MKGQRSEMGSEKDEKDELKGGLLTARPSPGLGQAITHAAPNIHCRGNNSLRGLKAGVFSRAANEDRQAGVPGGGVSG
ncbi:hypothetical protein Pmani_030255 [Petrolisthes manimaculis]|uniref:Uncharacterized protein n=1 Tax=Petrolisthes manimaculis TaxID=1843537 RepID=A0AAE1TW54_9EUCA|nr:hypothetical protein Pmani_030255 [Petrolisthes manimaculis]